MKKISTLPILILILLWVPVAFADVVDERLGTQASERIQESTRAMIEAGIDGEKAAELTRAMLQNRFSEEHTLRAQEIIRDTRRQKLPVEPVMNKAYEGIAKQVRTESVIRAMETVQERYAYAYRQAAVLTDDERSVRTIAEAMADSLAAKMAEGDCDRLMTSLRERTKDRISREANLLAEEVFTTTRAMARIGVSSANLTDMVTESLRNRYTVREIVMLRERFMENALGKEANRLAQEYASRIGQGERADGLGGTGPDGRGTGQGTSGSGRGETGDRGGSSGGEGGAGGSGGDSGGPDGGDGGSGNGGAGGRQ